MYPVSYGVDTRLTFQEVFDEKNLTRHAMIVGKSGVGKSRMVEALVVLQALRKLDDPNAPGIGVIDVATEFYDNCRARLAAIREEHPKGHLLDEMVVLIDPPKTDWITYDLLKCRYGESPRKRAQNLSNTFLSVWQEDRTVVNRMIHLMDSVFELLILAKRPFIAAEFFLQSPEYRKEILKVLPSSQRLFSDPDLQQFHEMDSLKSYWNEHFKNLPRDVAESSLNRFTRLISNDDLRQVFGSTTSTLDFKQLIDDGKIVLINAPMNDLRMGEDGAFLFGAFMLAEFHQAFQSRAEDRRKPFKAFTMCCDEFPQYATKAAQKIMGLDRKFGFNLVLLAQSITGKQTGDDLLIEVLKLVNTIIAFRVDLDDAKILRDRVIDLDLLSVKHATLRYQKKPAFEFGVGGFELQMGEMFDKVEQLQFYGLPELEYQANKFLQRLSDRYYLIRRANADQQARLMVTPEVRDVRSSPLLDEALERQWQIARGQFEIPKLEANPVTRQTEEVQFYPSAEAAFADNQKQSREGTKQAKPKIPVWAPID